MPFKPARLYLPRRSIIAAAPALALVAGASKYAAAQSDEMDLPDALDAMTQCAPTPPPQVVFLDAAGRHLSLRDYAGHVLVVNLWATWCGPCVAELPSFAALAPKIRPSGGLVLPISIDTAGAATVRPFYAEHAVSTLPILLDPDGQNMQRLNADGIPCTIVINAAGKMVARTDGAANWNSARVVRFLAGLNGQAPAGLGDGFIPV